MLKSPAKKGFILAAPSPIPQENWQIVTSWMIDGEPFAVKKPNDPFPRPYPFYEDDQINYLARNMVEESKKIRSGQPFYLKELKSVCKIDEPFHKSFAFESFYPINLKNNERVFSHFVKLPNEESLTYSTALKVLSAFETQVHAYQCALEKPDPIPCSKLCVDDVDVHTHCKDVTAKGFTIWETQTREKEFPIDWDKTTKWNQLTPEQLKRLHSIQRLFKLCYNRYLPGGLYPATVGWKDNKAILLHPFERHMPYEEYLRDFLPDELNAFSAGNGEIYRFLDPQVTRGVKRKNDHELASEVYKKSAH